MKVGPLVLLVIYLLISSLAKPQVQIYINREFFYRFAIDKTLINCKSTADNITDKSSTLYRGRKIGKGVATR